MENRRRFLVVLRCGDRSLHPGWLSAETDDRNWDLHLSYFGSHAEPYSGPARGDSISFEKGSKYHGLFDYIEGHLEEIKKYELVAFPDDDLQLIAGNLSRLFEIASMAGGDLTQASLDRRSFFSHDLALQRKRFLYREVDFVEVMLPIFKVEFLLEVYNYFKLNHSSWGLDFIWSKKAQETGRKMVIVDACAFLHTRRVGLGGQYNGKAMEGLYGELDSTVEKYNVKIWIGRTLAAWTPKGPSNEPKFLINRPEYLPRIYKYAKKFMNINIISE